MFKYLVVLSMALPARLSSPWQYGGSQHTVSYQINTLFWHLLIVCYIHRFTNEFWFLENLNGTKNEQGISSKNLARDWSVLFPPAVYSGYPDMGTLNEYLF